MTGPEITAPLLIRLQKDAPACPYCCEPSRFYLSSEIIYNGRDFGPCYVCRPCSAWVGAHRDTLLPLGRLADKRLRELKVRVHAAFDPLWRNLADAYPDVTVVPKRLSMLARARAYAWLGNVMLIEPEHCHIGAFSPERCEQALSIIESYKPDATIIRVWAKHRQEMTDNATLVNLK